MHVANTVNGLASKYSGSVVKHAFVNLRSIMRMAQKLKFFTENLGDETRMPITRPVERPTITPEQINRLISVTQPIKVDTVL
jgi:hypothetical protein